MKTRKKDAEKRDKIEREYKKDTVIQRWEKREKERGSERENLI